MILLSWMWLLFQRRSFSFLTCRMGMGTMLVWMQTASFHSGQVSGNGHSKIASAGKEPFLKKAGSGGGASALVEWDWVPILTAQLPHFVQWHALCDPQSLLSNGSKHPSLAGWW